MKMEMSYRDKVILIVLLIVLIVVGGFFALIKPKYDDYKASEAVYQTTKTEWDGIEQKLNAIQPLKDTITKNYTDAKKTAQIFVNGVFETANKTLGNEKTSLEVDKYLTPMIDECNLEVKDMVIDAVSAAPMTYYYYVPDVLTYSLLEAADINGDYAAQVAEGMADSVVLATREVSEVMCQNITLTVEGQKESLMTFLGMIEEDPNAVLVNSVSISDYQFLGGLEQESVGPDGTIVITIDENGIGTSEMTIAIGFYNAKEIDEPNLGD